MTLTVLHTIKGFYWRFHDVYLPDEKFIFLASAPHSSPLHMTFFPVHTAHQQHQLAVEFPMKYEIILKILFMRAYSIKSYFLFYRKTKLDLCAWRSNGYNFRCTCNIKVIFIDFRLIIKNIKQQNILLAYA